VSNTRKQFARNALAGFLVFWLSGVLFLVCCGTTKTQAAEMQFCPLAAKGKSHCHKTKSVSDLPNVSALTETQNFDCCGFLPAVFDKTRKIEKTQHAAKLVDKVKIDSPKFIFDGKDFESFAYYQPFVSNQTKIFIKNCIFRI
jgi:hypothetical protein